MKKRLNLIIGAFMLFVLAACSTGGSTTSPPPTGDKTPVVYSESYGLHYTTQNYLISQSQNDSVFFANSIEGLVEVDNFGRFVGVGATEWSERITDDGKQVWTFKLNEEVKWFDPAKNLEEVRPVQAIDYVDALRYVLNPRNASATVGIVQTFIDGSKEYFDALANGEEADFNTVGVKAIDEYTLEYTLPRPISYFLSALTYSVFSPVNGEYLREMGLDFGTNGKNILINGPYYTTVDDKDARVFLRYNPFYYNVDQVEATELRFIFVATDAGSDWARLRYENGELSAFRIDENDTTGWTKYITGADGRGSSENPVSPLAFIQPGLDDASFGYLIAPGRYYKDHTILYKNTKHPNDASRRNTALALENENFRVAIQWGLDATIWNQRFSPSRPDDFTRNIYTIPNLALDENGKDYIEYYYEEFAKQKNISVEEAREALKDGNDYYQDDTIARALFEKAKEELGNTVTFPVLLDVLGSSNNDSFLFQKALYDDLNKEFGEFVNAQTLDISGPDEFQDLRDSNNFDLYGVTGWGPDFADPITFADTFTLTKGDLLSQISLDLAPGEVNADIERLREKILGEYTELVLKADAVTGSDEISERFKLFAEAEYKLLNEVGVFLPAYTRVGSSVIISNIIPKSRPEATFGNNSSRLKYIRIHKGEMTAEDAANYIKEWEAKKAELV